MFFSTKKALGNNTIDKPKSKPINVTWSSHSAGETRSDKTIKFNLMRWRQPIIEHLITLRAPANLLYAHDIRRFFFSCCLQRPFKRLISSIIHISCITVMWPRWIHSLAVCSWMQLNAFTISNGFSFRLLYFMEDKYCRCHHFQFDVCWARFFFSPPGESIWS